MSILTNRKTWIVWFVLTILLTSYYAYALIGTSKTDYLPGMTTAGHYQIELTCQVCHSNPFGGRDVLQKACINCHGVELKAVEDSHPKSKFTDPRNADRTAILDARYCITCHKEHIESRTHLMGVTLPNDFCAYCHFDIAKDRKSHKDMTFDSCANAGCHNFHDNKALYEDFLVKHANEADLLTSPRHIIRDFSRLYQQQRQADGVLIKPLMHNQAVYPTALTVESKILAQWAATSHAESAVNCRDCHNDPNVKNAQAWIAKPDNEVCDKCHRLEMQGYLQGKHGMRLAQDLPAMQPILARTRLAKDSAGTLMGCMSCHDSHSFSTVKAAVDACLTCHIDKHSKAYKKSPHYAAFMKAQTDASFKDKAVSCATCHLPRLRIKHDGVERTLVQHNQNENLRPNEKMIRAVCMNCHGLGYSINALADADLITRNFDMAPVKKITSIEMALRRVKEKAEEKRRREAAEPAVALDSKDF